ncbi:MAG: FAD-binding protein [Planctomycetota bacterium]|nr:MAG: FAD-binding protein [Planctomycetota bacterium]
MTSESGTTQPESIEFEFDGHRVHAESGQSVAGALHAAGEHIVSRSFKYHRPRGLLCMSGRCPNCICTVDGTPNVRICTQAAKPGMVVKSQNAWPSVKFDLLRIFDKLHRFMPVGFYYKRMYKPRWMWPVWEKFIRRIAGLGTINREHGAEGVYDKQNLFTDVAVIGGGLAGLNAALAAADAGVTVTLIDEQSELGGHLRHDPDLAESIISRNALASGSSASQPDASAFRLISLSDLIRRVSEHPAITVISSAGVFGCYEGNYLGIQQGQRMIRLRAAQVIVATGCWERPLVFENNDLPGVMLASGAQRLLHLDHCQFPGEAVVVTDNAQGYRVANQLKAAGTRITAIVDVRDNPPESADGIRTFRGHTIISANGSRHVSGAVIAPLAGHPKQTLSCRWIVQAVGFTPANSLLYQNGCKLRYDESVDQAVVIQHVPSMYSAGAVNALHDPRDAALDGQHAGLAAAESLRSPRLCGETEPSIAEATQRRGERKEDSVPSCHYVSPSGAKKKFVCLCEDVTEKDICDAIDEGYSNIETLKRYSTVSMGPCQGKMCQSASIAICARHNGQSIAETGVTTARPPEQPLPLGVLAGRALHFSLVRRTPMNAWHEKAGAKMGDAGNWKRPQVYSSVDQEYEAVRQRAGVIDVSTLGKIELRGADVVKFLEFIYPNRFANLKVGRVRYGVICDDAGILLDDGTIARLGDDRFFLTTTTGNADAIDSWFRWWLAGRPEWDVRMTNVSGSYAAMNLAGPRSREVLKKLTDADLSSDVMPYLAASECQIAGVSAIVLRIGFVGELGYEIHVPSQFGLHVWEAILEAGREFSISPFGLEAQRVLRLEKKHLLPGIDTDALSNPLEADLPWIVKLDKDDFIGKESLARAQQRGDRNKLVGFRLSEFVVPDLASLVLCDGKLGGRITSCGYSPAVGGTIGLAWVPANLARNGETIQIQVNGRMIPAVVQDEPFYDPSGSKLKS